MSALKPGQAVIWFRPSDRPGKARLNRIKTPATYLGPSNGKKVRILVRSGPDEAILAVKAEWLEAAPPEVTK